MVIPIITHNQTTLIQRRLITDNILVAFEIFHDMNTYPGLMDVWP